jgi:hypothetical protein
MEYQIEGVIVQKVSFTVSADTREEALELAQDYTLNNSDYQLEGKPEFTSHFVN